MNECNQPLEIQVVEAQEQPYAGKWFPLVLLLKRRKGSDVGVRLRNIGCREKAVHLNTDMLERDVEIRPGETYGITLPILVADPRALALDSFYLQLDDHKQLFSLPEKQLTIQPALGQQLQLRLDSLCAYEAGTKIQLTIEHQGATRFRDLTISLEPETAVQAGKRIIRRVAFNPRHKEHPGDKEQLEAVVNAETLTIRMTALVDGHLVEARVVKEVPRLATRTERTYFRFLEPRRISVDQQTIYRTSGEEQELLVPAQGAYSLCGGESYQVVIRPQSDGVTDVQLRSIPGVVNVRNTEAANGTWKFLVDVSVNELFSKPERLFYDVKTKGDSLQGEIPLNLEAPRGKYLQMACALGIALTVQGVAALTRFIVQAHYSLTEAISEFQVGAHYQVLLILCIPVTWAGLLFYDRLQYRLRTEQE